MPDAKDIFNAALDASESGSFPYLIYGGIAVGLWGEPRFTEDVDLVIFKPEREAYKFLRAAAKHGFAVDEDLAIQQIQVNGWARLPLGDKDNALHLDFTLGDTAFDQSALKRRREVMLFGRKAWVVSPEDLIIYKLISSRPKDAGDLDAIIRRQKDLDAAYLRKWAAWWDKQDDAGIGKKLEELLATKR